MGFNSYCKALLPLIAVLLCRPFLYAQSSGHLAVGEPQKVVGKRNATVQVKIPCSVQAGYHVNSNKPNEDYLIPLKLTWTSTGALEGGAITYPKPSQGTYEFSEKPLSVFTGNFEITTRFKVPADAVGGMSILAGKLRYQACNNTMCFPPKTVDVKLPVEIR